MTVQELYTEIHGDFDDFAKRLGNADFVARFIVKFPGDECCRILPEVWAQGDDRESFRTAHSAKGVCANLAIIGLYELASGITEALREGNEDLRATTDVDALVAQYTEEYQRVVAAIEAFAAEQ